MTTIIDGKQISKDIKEELKQEVAELKAAGNKFTSVKGYGIQVTV